jgi:ABC-2 type transport system permease protein
MEHPTGVNDDASWLRKDGREAMTFSGRTIGQLSTVAYLRWRMFVNSLRSKRGKLELASRVIVSVTFMLGGLGGAFGMGAGAYYFVAEGKPQMLAFLLWPVFMFWQLFPLMATAFTNNPEPSDLLRFPLGYRAYFLIRLAYGSLDPAVALGSLWLSAILLGVGFAVPTLLPWTALVLFLFAAFNLLLMQMIFAWIERWLAQRRTREIFGVLFILLMLSFQLIGPMMERFGKRSRPELNRFFEVLIPIQGVLPPGLAADAINQAARAQFLVGFSSFLLLSVMAAAAACLLHLRLRKQFRGESFSETTSRQPVEKVRDLRLGWRLPGFSSAVAAVFEKEMRYLARSGPMLLTLIMPIFMLIVFRVGAMNPARHSGGFLGRVPSMAFPAAAGYTMLLLTNLIYNSFGSDRGGIQFFYASPARFSQIVLGKNLAHAVVLLFDTALSWLAVTYMYGGPPLNVTMATLSGLLFAAPLNFAIGNVLSLYSPKRVDFSTFGRQRASQITVLVSLGAQMVLLGVSIAIFVIARYYANFGIATGVFLALAAISFFTYGMILQRMDGIALERRETLMAELCRA